MKTYPAAFRHRVIALTEAGRSSGEIAEVLGVTASWVRSIVRLHKSGQSIEPKPRTNRRVPLAEREGERIRAQVAAHPGTTLEDLKRELGLSDSIANLWYALRTLGLSLKKKHSTRPSKAAPTSSSKGRPGKSSRRGSTHAGSSSSTRRSAPPT